MLLNRLMIRTCGLALVAGAPLLASRASAAPDDYSCNRRVVKAAPAALTAVPVNRFLDSLGINIHIDQGYGPDNYIEPIKYLGVRQVRDGTRRVDSLLKLARATGVRYSIVSSGYMPQLMDTAKALARADALLAIEGPNEPNNFALEYNGRKGGKNFGWSVVAEFQRDLYAQVKADPELSKYPVFGPSETGAETENVGLQFLKIPAGANTLFPDGTVFSDYANVHNYVSAVNGGYGDNQAWSAADPVLRGRWDGLAGNHGTTWLKKFQGYSNDELMTLPRVTTETGYPAGADPKEQHLQGIVLVNTYLAQFHRGWAYTYLYQLRDDEGGKSLQGLYVGDKPKLAAQYIHNLTTILADKRGAGGASASGAVQFATDSSTVHALAFVKSTGKRMLVIWGERANGTDVAKIDFRLPALVKIFDVVKGTEPIGRATLARSVCLDITDHAMMLEY
jgi:hypothetical protein